MDERFDVVVVGAGLAGLAAGATAAGAGASTVILDGHPAGGRASTDERGKYKFNRGPHALYKGGEAQAVLARLGVSTSGAFPPAGARGRYGDQVSVLPATLPTLLRSRLVSLRGKVALARFLGGVKKWRPGALAGVAATTAGDVDGLVRLLAEDAVLVSDGGPHKRAARHPIRGRDRLARFLANIGQRYDAAQATFEPIALNGELGIVISLQGERLAAIGFQVDEGLVHEVHVIVADDKLAALDRHVDML